jgi:hypothetical protein
MMMGFIRSAMQVSENLLRGMKPPGGRGGLAARLFAANHTLADLRYLRNHVLPASGLSLSPEAERLYERTAAELQRKVKALSDEAFPPNKSLHEQGPVPVKKPAAPAGNPIPFPSLRGGKKN